MAKPMIYLADLRYNYTGFLANDCMPLGVAYMKAYMNAELREVQSRLFAYPDHLWQAMNDSPPDVLMLSNYCWNEALSHHFAKLAKRLNPGMLILMGGPNISIDPDCQADYLRRHKDIDIYVLGEGDILAGEIVRLYLSANLSIPDFIRGEIPSSLFRRDGEVVRQPMWARKPDIEAIPSPWLSGALDEFFDGKLSPLMETNRGCPFTCTFCVQGTSWYTKVHNFSVERIKAELEYVAQRIHSVCPSMGTLRIADSNYGMFERDIEISGYLGELQGRYGWPGYIDATTGKNRADRIIKSVEKANGALVVYQAVQSLDDEVLRNIKRSTIKLEAYEQILMHIRGRGLRSNSDLILGLPGESLQTHVTSLHKLLDAGVSQVTNFQLMMLKGSELETPESRQRFGFETRYRVLPKNFGVYGGENVFDVEEIVVATSTLPFEHYIQARKYALVSIAFFHNNDFDVLLNLLERQGIRRAQWMDRVLGYMERSEGPIREFLNNFVAATKNELFATREACNEYYSRPENFARLMKGEIGENLMHKHNALSSFHLWSVLCETAMAVSRELLFEIDPSWDRPEFRLFCLDFQKFIDLQHASGSTVEQILAPSECTFCYDIPAWLGAGCPTEISTYRLEEPRAYRFELPEDSIRALRAALDVWTTDIKGLTKMVTRIKVAWQVRKARPISNAHRLEAERATAQSAA